MNMFMFDQKIATNMLMFMMKLQQDCERDPRVDFEGRTRAYFEQHVYPAVEAKRATENDSMDSASDVASV